MCALARPADAAPPPWLRIDRVEAEPSVFEGLTRVQLFLTAVNLHGVFLRDITGEDAWQLRIGNKRVRAPYVAGTFQGTGDELAVGIVIETTLAFQEVLPAIKEQVTAYLDELPRATQAIVIGYDDEIHGRRRVTSVARAIKEVDALEPAFAPGDHRLIEAVTRARKALYRAKPETAGAGLRKLMVVISDGRDLDPRPARYRKVARRAGRQGIRIHSLAYAPDENRYPLYGLGELSKHSEGTFRFPYYASGFGSHFSQLLVETLEQYVLTYYLPTEDIDGKRIRVEVPAKDLEAEPVRMPKITCGTETCAPGQYCAALRCVDRGGDEGMGVLGWILTIGGILLGLVVLFVAVSLILGWRMRRRAAAAALAQAAAEAEAQQAAPSHRIVPQGPHGGAVQIPGQPPSGGHQAYPPPSGGHQAYPPPSGAHPAARPPSDGHRIQPQMPPGSGAHHRAPSHSGHALPQAPGASAPAAAQRGAVAPSLLVLNGPLQGRRIPLQHGFLIGKAPECHLPLTGDGFASGHHAQILMDTAGGCTLVDHGSTNGTFINGVRATQQRLAHGMLIKVGSTEVRFLTQ